MKQKWFMNFEVNQIKQKNQQFKRRQICLKINDKEIKIIQIPLVSLQLLSQHSMRKKIIALTSHKEINDSGQFSGLASPIGDSTQLNAQNQNILSEAINKKFSNMMKNRKIKKMTDKFKVERGRNNTIKYEDEFQFKEQWQLTDKSNYTLHYNYFFPQKFLFRFLNVVILFMEIFLVWALSIFRLFSYEESIWIFSYSLVVCMLDVILKTFFIVNFMTDDKIKNQHKKIQKKQYLENFIGNVFCALYSILGLAQFINDVHKDVFLILDVACIVVIYQRCEEIYKNFKMLIVCSKYKAYMKIFDLMSNLFLLTHIFGILIFGVSRLQPGPTYLSYAETKGSLSWFDKYIYSIYFSSTTMLTVGYGDLLPATIQQIAVVLIMQLFGIVMIGYINGQVGDVLCTLRRERQSLENDLTNADKLSKSFKLSHQTSQKIHQYLINNRKIDQQLNIQQENNLLSKINDQLRLEANYTNHINIIKECLFFVYNFSKKTQIEISTKLNKVFFSPNETIPQIMGKEKIYILSKGQISLFISKKNKKGKNGRKILRILSKKNDTDFHENSFGHTALILGRPTELKAISKDFAICHTIQRHDFLDALSIDSNDLQAFHQMRAKYETSKHPQKQQAPQFFTIRQHYCPNPQYVIKKYLRKNHNTKRKDWIRCRQKSRTIIQTLVNDGDDFEQTPSENNESSFTSSQPSIVNGDQGENQKCLTEQQRQNKYKNLSLGTLANLNIRARGYSQKYCNKKYQQKREELVSKFKSVEFEEPFEVCKQYFFFFKHANLSHVIRKSSLQANLLQVVSSFIEILPSFQDQNPSTSQDAKIFRHKRMLRSLPF